MSAPNAPASTRAELLPRARRHWLHARRAQGLRMPSRRLRGLITSVRAAAEVTGVASELVSASPPARRSRRALLCM